MNAAHVLCKSREMDEKRKQIMYFNEIISGFDKEYGYYHVIAFSSLSKCSIWPGMFKTSHKLLPSLI